MHSCLYEGWVSHRRLTPTGHAFRYRLFMAYLDLDELPGVFDRFWLWSADRFSLAWFRRADHLGSPDVSLKQSVQDFVHRQGGQASGPIRMLTHLRYFGVGFNPVSFYYCFDADDEHVEHIVAEVNNTPWNEQHCYLLRGEDNTGDARMMQFSSDKEFHVSPFLPMDMRYTWRIGSPAEALRVRIDNHHGSTRVFSATLGLVRKPLDQGNAASVLLRYPFMTIQVVLGIYWQALRLWLKKTPLYGHPAGPSGMNSEN